MRKVVLLPAPFGPTNAATQASGTFMLRLETATRLPKVLVSPTVSTAGCLVLNGPPLHSAGATSVVTSGGGAAWAAIEVRKEDRWGATPSEV